MGSHAISSVSEEERSEIVRRLISLYCFEMLAMHYNLGVQNRLQGQALFLKFNYWKPGIFGKMSKENLPLI